MDSILFRENRQMQTLKNITITAQTPFTTVEVAEYAMVKKQVAETALNSCVQSTMCTSGESVPHTNQIQGLVYSL